jgi:hypothetical protein
MQTRRKMLTQSAQVAGLLAAAGPAAASRAGRVEPGRL